MARYILRRLLYLIPVWVGISLLAYGMACVAPGDPALVILQQQSDEMPTQEAVARLHRELGLDDPFPVRYARWLVRAAQGDLGTSYRTGEPVLAALLERFPATFEIALAAMICGVLIALPLGVISAMRQDSLVDHAARLLALAGASMPSFWLGYVLIMFLAVTLKLVPVAGHGTWKHLVLPVLTLGLGGAAVLTRLTRASMLEVFGEDHMRTARAKGLAEWAVVLRHGLRNALIPIVTVISVRFGQLLGGAVIVETVFAWPGIGTYVVNSIFSRDYPVIQGFVLLMGTVFVAINLVVDLAYPWLDPRVRLIGAMGNGHAA